MTTDQLREIVLRLENALPQKGYANREELRRVIEDLWRMYYDAVRREAEYDMGGI